MVLQGEAGVAKLFCLPGGVIIGMFVVDNETRAYGEGVLEMFHYFIMETRGFDMLHITKVLAHEGVGAFVEANGVFKLGPKPQYAWQSMRRERRMCGSGGMNALCRAR